MAFGEFYLADVAGSVDLFFFGQKIAPLDVWPADSEWALRVHFQ